MIYALSNPSSNFNHGIPGARAMDICTEFSMNLCYRYRWVKFWSIVSCCVLSEFVPHDEVVAQLEADTLLSEASLGVGGRCFIPGSYPQLATLRLKVACH